MVEKSNVCKKVYTFPDGTTGAHAKQDAVSLSFAFTDGETIVVTPGDFPTEIQTCLMFFGISEKLGNAYAGAAKKAKETGETVGEVAFDLFESLRERLVLGEWIAEREAGGPRIGQLVQAVINCKARQGETVEFTAVAEILKDKEIREMVEKDPVVVAEVASIRATAAAERATAAAAAAEGQTGESLGFITSSDPKPELEEAGDPGNPVAEPAQG